LALVGSVHVAAAGRTVSFRALDGTELVATFYEAASRPSAGIVLVHMLGRSRDEWTPMASRLQAEGAAVLALDLRGHGESRGDGAASATMVADVQAAVDWLSANPSIRSASIAIVGSSLGANLAALTAANIPTIRAVALVSPSMDYRGVRLDGATLKRLQDRPMWLAASVEDSYALRTIRDIVAVGGAREQRLTSERAHGTALLAADPALARELVDWLRSTLVF
jgi:alpha-beta hydrolase superfamily lysophospholipase